MPRSSRKSTTSSSNIGNPPVSASSSYCLPSNGSARDIARLSSVLGLSRDVVASVMTCQGMGVRSRSDVGTNNGEGNADAAGMAAMSSVWGDWMNEEMTNNMTSSNNNAAAAAAANDDANKTAQATTSSSSSDPRRYTSLPLAPPRSSPGILLQTGTLDSTIPGRSHPPKQPRPVDVDCPTILFPSLFKGVKFTRVVSNPAACHSVALTSDGKAYGWGRNENGQLGLGYASPCVPVPTLLFVGNNNDNAADNSNDDDNIIVSAGVGKYHTLLVTKTGTVYASGGNKCGQLGVNNEKMDGCDKFRKCVVDYNGNNDGDDDERIVHVSSWCGGINVLVGDVTTNHDTMIHNSIHILFTPPHNKLTLSFLATRHLAARTYRRSFPPKEIYTPPARPSTVN